MEDVVVYLVVFLILGLMLASAVIAGLKGKYGLVALGLLIHLTWYVGAIRLAKPDSFWARKFYAPGSAKRAAAEHRFAGKAKPQAEAVT